MGGSFFPIQHIAPRVHFHSPYNTMSVSRINLLKNTMMHNKRAEALSNTFTALNARGTHG